MCFNENHQFWFIKFRWRRATQSNWTHVNELIGEHPLGWLHTTRTTHGRDPLPKPQGTALEYVLDFYVPVSADQFGRYKDVIDE